MERSSPKAYRAAATRSQMTLNSAMDGTPGMPRRLHYSGYTHRGTTPRPMRDAITLVFALTILYSLVIVEILFVLLAIRSTRTNPGFGRRWFASAERWLGRLAARRGASVLAIGALALAGRALLAPA